VRYLGAKAGSGTYQAIINLMPPHDSYIEPFFGTGAIMRLKIPAANNVAIDKDITAGLPTIALLRDQWPDALFEIHKTDAMEYLKAGRIIGFNRQTLLYCDPPYMHATRTSKCRYKHELSDEDHWELLRILRSVSCNVMLSGYRNPLYNKSLANWFSLDFQAMTRGGVRTETVWCNFDPAAIHYHTFAGKNFTDRQRRWASRYAKLPPGERQAVLAAILASDPE